MAEQKNSLNESFLEHDSFDHQINKPIRRSNVNAILAAFVAGLGSFTFGYALGFTSPVLTAMMTLDKDDVFNDAQIETVKAQKSPLILITLVSRPTSVHPFISLFDHGSTVTLSSDHASLFSSILTIGGMIGSMVGGIACDKYGRKGTILFIALPFGFTWVWMAITSNYYQLLIARFLSGIFVGVISMAVPLYIGETAPTHLRGSLGAVNQLLVAIGIESAYVVGIAVQSLQSTNIQCNQFASGGDDALNALVLHGKLSTDLSCSDVVSGWKCSERGKNDEFTCEGVLPAWRWLAWCVSAVCFILFLAMLRMPETPPYLHKKGKFNLAKKALKFLNDNDENCAQFDLEELHRQKMKENNAKKSRASVSRASTMESRPTSYYSVENNMEVADYLSDDDDTVDELTSPNSPDFSKKKNEFTESVQRSPLHDVSDQLLPPSMGRDDDDGGGGGLMIASKQLEEEEEGGSGKGSIRRSESDKLDGIGDGCILIGDDELRASISADPALTAPEANVIEILTAPDVRRPLIMAVVLMSFQQCSGVNAVIFYSGSILESAGMEDANVGGALVMGVQVVFTVVSVLLMDSAGRKVLLGFSTSGMAVCSTCMAVFFVNNKHPSWLALVALMGYIATFSIGLGSIPWLFMGEVFPSHARAPACSTVALVNWGGSFIITYFFSGLQTLIEPQGCFFLFAIVCVVACIFATTVLPETKGRTFEEIASDFRKAAGLGDPILTPPFRPSNTPWALTLCLAPFSCIVHVFIYPIFSFLGMVLFGIFLFLFVITLVGPFYESSSAKSDENVLTPAFILRKHKEMFMLEIPPGVNKASRGKSYRIMVRLTVPSSGETSLPPVVCPGGLGANLCFMARHQDDLTTNGFIVVNFDRLGVGFSDPYPEGSTLSASALDVANELNFVMRHCELMLGLENARWISVGRGMGANITNAFLCLYPDRLCGFLNLNAHPHALLTHTGEKFLCDWPKLLRWAEWLSWTGIPRFLLTRHLGRSISRGAQSDVFTSTQTLGLLCRSSSFRALALECVTLMSCCDLEIAAWGSQATIHFDSAMMLLMASLEPSTPLPLFS